MVVDQEGLRPNRHDGWALGLSALLVGTGALHLIAPHLYENMVPHALPWSRWGWTMMSGVAELACAGLLAKRSTRRTGATLTAILFVVIFAGNIQMAIHWRHRDGVAPLVAYVRLPLQVPLVLWALDVRRTTSTSC